MFYSYSFNIKVFYEELIFICKQISADKTTHPLSRSLEQVDGNKRETGNEDDKTW